MWEAFKLGEKKESAIKATVESLANVEKQIEGKKFFGEEEIGYLDLVYGWLAHWLNVMEEVGRMSCLIRRASHHFINAHCKLQIQLLSLHIETLKIVKEAAGDDGICKGAEA
ncbi:hypothetical protein FEM48_Zijuj05G0094200 [Ziziphus jujuba var. spinosa]|uniref:GST C-terminal domain-containing protein n=1 Tax=Ziziphus jujuba var. spinosa TaxID=714518 RepID=A0A978VE57_ZIZJJ|nr:hypothetical protein FEM48_Zijuj05G0094200 [Ziziphus jujuba var. spinosa]